MVLVSYARRCRDSRCSLEDVVIPGKDPLDPRQEQVPFQPNTEALCKRVDGLRISVLSEGSGRTAFEPDVDEAMGEALGQLGELGATITKISVPEHLDTLAIGWPRVSAH